VGSVGRSVGGEGGRFGVPTAHRGESKRPLNLAESARRDVNIGTGARKRNRGSIWRRIASSSTPPSPRAQPRTAGARRGARVLFLSLF
jgi:hypothetical protein